MEEEFPASMASAMNKFLLFWGAVATIVAAALGAWQFIFDASNDDLLAQLQAINETLEQSESLPLSEGQTVEAVDAAVSLTRRLVSQALAEGQIESGEVYLISEGGVVIAPDQARELITASGKLTTIGVNDFYSDYVRVRIDGEAEYMYVGSVYRSLVDSNCRYILTAIDLENKTITVRLDCSKDGQLQLSP